MSIKMKDYVVAETKEEGVIVLSTSYRDRELKIVGSTIPTSVSPTPDYSHTITLYPEKGKTGIIALSVRITSGRDRKGSPINEYFSAFLLVGPSKDGTPIIDLQDQWVPTQRIGGLCGGSHDEIIEIIVKIGGKVFTSEVIYDYQYTDGKKKPHRVTDTDLLCRYLFGEAEASEVISAATAPKLEENARKQLPKLVAQVNELTGERDRLSAATREALRELLLVEPIVTAAFNLRNYYKGTTSFFIKAIVKPIIEAYNEYEKRAFSTQVK